MADKPLSRSQQRAEMMRRQKRRRAIMIAIIAAGAIALAALTLFLLGRGAVSCAIALKRFW